MREDMIEMLKCESVYALSNWSDSKGAMIEIDIAEKVGLSIIYQQVEKAVLAA